MEKYYRQTVGIPVVTQAGQMVTRVRDIQLNTDSGKIVGFFVFGSHTKVVTPTDILEWDAALIIHDAEDVVEAEEVVNVMRAIQKEMKIMKKKVFTKSGEHIGKVLDYGMNDKLFELTVLVVAKSFLGLIFWDKKIISAKDIVEVKPDRIIVKDLVKTVEMEKFQIDMAAP